MYLRPVRTSAATVEREVESRPAGFGRHGVLLIHIGSPDRPEVVSVRRYLAEFLADPQVVRLPVGLGWLNRPLGALMGRVCAARSAARYRRIWTERGSPLTCIAADQAAALAEQLPGGWQVFSAMRYGGPSIAETLERIEAAGVKELVVVPMYPQFSGPTTGTILGMLYSRLNRGGHRLNVTTRALWCDDAGYVYAQAKLIEEYARAHQLKPENTFLLFSGHGIPSRYVARGDPYRNHLLRTVKLVTERLGWPSDRTGLSYQSRIGPGEWLKPDTGEVLEELVRSGQKRVLVCAISFTADCLETLEEIDLRCRARFEASGGELFLCPALNTFGPFIAALKNLVLNGPRPVTSWSKRERPLLGGEDEKDPAGLEIGSLVMLGVSVPSQVGPGRGPRLTHTDAERLCRIKKSRLEVMDLLRQVCGPAGFAEGFLWNTCHRFEFYGWHDASKGVGERAEAVASAQRLLFGGPGEEGLSVNVIFGRQAWHHLMRTVAGLNSGLPGDVDVVEQLQTAHRVAEQAGVAGRRSKRLASETVALEGELRSRTEWGRYDCGYCSAALWQITRITGIDWAACRCVVIGGSTTSRSLLTTLTKEFEVPGRQLTLVYRGHHDGQMKLLRKAIGSGRRVRVNSYGERAVLRAIAEADVVLFGIDRDEPVLGADQIRDLRDYSSRPLTVIDLNTFGSTMGLKGAEGVTLEGVEGVSLWDASQVDQAVAAYAKDLTETYEFARAVESAEAWIVERTAELEAVADQPRLHRSGLRLLLAEVGPQESRSGRNHARDQVCSAEPDRPGPGLGERQRRETSQENRA